MKYSCRINGYDSLNLTKLDILDDLPEIFVGVKYMVSGKELDGFPGALDTSY
jgi:adenylosuccinate synthase